MPTLEERLKELEQARVATAQHLQRIDEQIDALQQQLAEQEKRLEQSTEKKFETLMHVIVQHANNVTTRFEALDKRFGAIDKRFEALDKRFDEQAKTRDARFEEQTRAIRAQFEEITIPLTTLATTVASQGQDIRSLLERSDQLDSIKEDITDLDIKYDQLDRNITGLHGKVDLQGKQLSQQGQEIKALTGKFDALDGKVDLILSRLPQ